MLVADRGKALHNARRYVFALLILVSMAGFFSFELFLIASRHSLLSTDVKLTPKNGTGMRVNPLDNVTMAAYLQKEVRVLCWALIRPKRRKRAKSIIDSWGRHCQEFVFFSNVTYKNLNVTVLNCTQGWGSNDILSWHMTMAAYKYIHKHYLHTVDWFYRADDSTYTIMENLRYMLYPYAPDTAVYFGCPLSNWAQNQFQGGVGYVLSRAALKRFVELALPNPNWCASGNESKIKASSMNLADCLKHVNVSAGDTRVGEGRRRLFPNEPNNHLITTHNYTDDWSLQYAFHVTYEGFACCSEYFISFENVGSELMPLFEYMFYHLRPYGLTHRHDLLPSKLPVGQVFLPTKQNHSDLKKETEIF